MDALPSCRASAASARCPSRPRRARPWPIWPGCGHAQRPAGEQPDSGGREPGRPLHPLLPLLHAGLRPGRLPQPAVVRRRRGALQRPPPAAPPPTPCQRAAFLQIMGSLAGKWPHSMTLQPGGVAGAPDRRSGCGCSRRCVPRVAGAAAVRRPAGGHRRHRLGRGPAPLDGRPAGHGQRLPAVPADRRRPANSPASAARRIASSSHGAYPRTPAGSFPACARPAGRRLQPFEPADVVEDVSHAWLEADVPRHPPRATPGRGTQGRRLYLVQGAALAGQVA